MQALLKKQSDTLNILEERSKRDNVIQLAQLVQTRRIDEDGNRVEDQLKELNKTVKSLNDKGGDGLNSNVIKLFKEIKKTTDKFNSRPINAEEASNITGKVGERRQFNTLEPRVENLKEGVKDFFTMRGFLDKTGIVKRGSGGIVSEYLDRGEAKKNYVDQRMKTKGTTFGSKESFGKQFDEQQRVQGDMRKNEKEIQNLRDSGATDIGLKRGGYFKTREDLATQMAKADPSMRPEGFDARTGKIKEKPEGVKAESAKIIPFTGGKKEPSSSDEEAMFEQNRMISDQTDLLIKIEENTRASVDLLNTQGKKAISEKGSGDKGSGFMDMLGSSKFGKIAKGAGKGLMTGAKAAGGFLAKRAGPVAALAAVGAGAYAGYQGYQAAGDKEQSSLKEIDAKVASGEISEEQAKGLRQESKETGTVERSSSAGKGAGMAAGGAAGALKGAAVGAAIGSAVPIVGTVIGGAIGAGLGAVGGGALGAKAGEFLGDKFGKAKNFLFGKSGDSDSKGSEVGPNYKARLKDYKSSTPVDHLEKQYPGIGKKFRELAEKTPPRSDSQQMLDSHEHMLKNMAVQEISKGNIVAPGDKTAEALKKTSEGVTPNATDKANQRQDDVNKRTDELLAKAPANLKDDISYQNSKRKQAEMEVKAGRTLDGKPLEEAKLEPADRPSSGNIISKQSGDNEQAKIDAGKQQAPTNNIVSAPTNNVTNQTQIIRSPIRNQESSQSKYLSSRYSF